MHFQLACLEESSSQKWSVIVLWTPADLFIIWRVQWRLYPSAVAVETVGGQRWAEAELWANGGWEEGKCVFSEQAVSLQIHQKAKSTYTTRKMEGSFLTHFLLYFSCIYTPSFASHHPLPKGLPLSHLVFLWLGARFCHKGYGCASMPMSVVRCVQSSVCSKVCAECPVCVWRSSVGVWLLLNCWQGYGIGTAGGCAGDSLRVSASGSMTGRHW